MRALWILTRAEIHRLLRTQEIFLYLLLPSLLLIPCSLWLATLLISLAGRINTVAVPPDLPPQFELVARLEDRNIKVLLREDPYAAWESGAADAAVLKLERQEGIGGAEVVEHSNRAAWRLEMVADSPTLVGQINDIVDDAAEDELAALVALAGGKPNDVMVVSLRTVSAEDGDNLPFSIKRGLCGYLLLLLGMIAFFFLCLPQIADRREGVLETMRVLPISPYALLWARCLAMVLVQLSSGILLVGNVLLTISATVGDVTLPSVWMAVAGVGGLIFVNAGYVCVGVLAPTAKIANSFSAVPMTIHGGLLLAAVWNHFPFSAEEAPSWLPLGGVLMVMGPVACFKSLASSLGCAALLVTGAGHLLQTRVGLVLRRGDE